MRIRSCAVPSRLLRPGRARSGARPSRLQQLPPDRRIIEPVQSPSTVRSSLRPGRAHSIGCGAARRPNIRDERQLAATASLLAASQISKASPNMSARNRQPRMVCHSGSGCSVGSSNEVMVPFFFDDFTRCGRTKAVEPAHFFTSFRSSTGARSRRSC